MKVVYNVETAVTLKKSLDDKYKKEHKKTIITRTIGLIVTSIVFLFGPALIYCCIFKFSGDKALLTLGGGMVCTLLGGYFTFDNFAELEYDVFSYKEKTGLYCYPPSVVYMLLSENRKVFSIEKEGSDTIGIKREIKMHAKDTDGETITATIDVFNKESDSVTEEVLDLEKSVLLFPRQHTVANFEVITELAI